MTSLKYEVAELAGIGDAINELFANLGLPACAKPNVDVCTRVNSRGMDSLQNHEVLALALDLSVGEAKNLMTRLGGLLGIARSHQSSLLQKLRGQAELAVKLSAIKELQERLGKEDWPIGRGIHQPDDALQFLKVFSTRSTESFWVMLLDAQNRVEDIVEIMTGTVNTCVFHPGEAMRMILMSNCAGFIIVHNHPSGNHQFSADDVALSHGLKKASKLLEVKMIDHLLIAGNDVISWRAKSWAVPNYLIEQGTRPSTIGQETVENMVNADSF